MADFAGRTGAEAPEGTGRRLRDGRGAWSDLAPEVAYQVLALRAAVFVVEQQCAYLDVDGLDLGAGAEHRWLADDRGVAAYLRVLVAGEAPGTRRIGRVVTRPDRRSEGLAASLVAAVVADHGEGVLVLAAQSQLVPWYRGFGFTPDGAEYLEDGIPHTPMRRLPGPLVG
jgi:ElaA protein